MDELPVWALQQRPTPKVASHLEPEVWSPPPSPRSILCAQISLKVLGDWQWSRSVQATVTPNIPSQIPGRFYPSVNLEDSPEVSMWILNLLAKYSFFGHVVTCASFPRTQPRERVPGAHWFHGIPCATQEGQLTDQIVKGPDVGHRLWCQAACVMLDTLSNLLASAKIMRVISFIR